MKSAGLSRRHALVVLLGACGAAPRKLAGGEAVRLAISETQVGDVNLNDARVAMRLWLKRLADGLDVVIDPALFSSTGEIVERVRAGLLDAVAVNVLEYRQIAGQLDPSRIVTSGGEGGPEQYLLLVRRDSGVQDLGQLRNRRLTMLKTPRMSLAPAWISTLLEEGRYGTAETFFGSLASETKVSRAVLPVFFKQADACVVSKGGFASASELNPQVGRQLVPLASSPFLVVNFYVFRKNYHSPEKEKLIQAISNIRRTPGGREMAALFQFDDLAVREGSSLSSALELLDRADRAHERQSGGGKK